MREPLERMMQVLVTAARQVLYSSANADCMPCPARQVVYISAEAECMPCPASDDLLLRIRGLW